MKKARNILVVMGMLAIIFTIVILVIGIKVVSTVFIYVTGILVFLAAIGLLIYYGRRLFGKTESE